MDFHTLSLLRANHPAWRLLCAEHAIFIISFLYKTFILPNLRTLSSHDLIEKLDDELFQLREQFGEKSYPKSALDYLNDWADKDKRWLRKFYKEGTDEVQFDLSPAVEKAIGWLVSLTERQFVGTESRLLTLFDLLKQMNDRTETDPQKRIAELHKQRQEIEAEIARIEQGDLNLLDDTALKDRFLQFTQGARELLSDFREVEHNFRELDRSVREKITLWEGSKGELLTEIMGECDAIADSDQGKSFRAFFDFLLSNQRQQEFSTLLDRVMELEAVRSLNPDSRQRRIHYDWLEAGEHTQRTIAGLSQQLRYFLDNRAWLENRRIMDILKSISKKAIALKNEPIKETAMELDDFKFSIELPLERPLYSPTIKTKLSVQPELADETDIDPSALFNQIVIDKAKLVRNVRQALQHQTQITLQKIIENTPLEQGLAELLAYLQLGQEQGVRLVIDENIQDEIHWHSGEQIRFANLPRVIFSK